MLILFFSVAVSSVLMLNPRASAQSARAWTAAGSTGTIDEDSTSISQVRNFTVTLLSGATGSVHVRYNITPTAGISSFCPAITSQVRVRFRNSDNAGTTAKVSFDIHSTGIGAGGDNILYSFDSNAKGLGGSFTTFTDSAASICYSQTRAAHRPAPRSASTTWGGRMRSNCSCSASSALSGWWCRRCASTIPVRSRWRRGRGGRRRRWPAARK